MSEELRFILNKNNSLKSKLLKYQTFKLTRFYHESVFIFCLIIKLDFKNNQEQPSVNMREIVGCCGHHLSYSACQVISYHVMELRKGTCTALG